jgi:LysM repeat protein
MRRNRRSIVLAAAIVLTAAIAAPTILPGTASAAPTRDSVHIVQRGETLSGIAARYGMNMWTLARMNGIANPSRIYVGQRLLIPCTRPTGRVHVVRPGETLTHIALRYGVNAWTIARANGITNLNVVYVGQRLTIPGAPPPPPPPKPPPKKDATLPSSFPGPWTGEYYDNAYLSGAPYTTRTDPSVNFNWNAGPPAGGMPTNHFSVRWSGSFYLSGGTYRFYARVDDGVRLSVDGERIINGWRDGGFRLYSADKALNAGHHTVEVSYYEGTGVARVHVWWKKISDAEPPEPPATEMWYGEFFANESVFGSPVATHHTPWIGFEWKGNSPLPGVPHNHFSARWTRRLHLEEDHYRFCAMSDDGARIWVDGVLVLDEWHPNNGVAYCGTTYAHAGIHDVKVEYYEHSGEALIYVWWEPD